MASTKEKAIKDWQKAYGKMDSAYFVYQFPKGHWACCTVNSPVGQSLQESGFIYPEHNCKAQQWEIIHSGK